MTPTENSTFYKDYRDAQTRRLQIELDGTRRNQELAAIVLYTICGVCWAVILVALWAFL